MKVNRAFESKVNTTDEWVYVPRKWYWLKDRGGYLVFSTSYLDWALEGMFTNIGVSTRYNSKVDRKWLETIERTSEIPCRVGTQLGITGRGLSGVQKIIRIYFQRQDDAVQFKLLHL